MPIDVPKYDTAPEPKAPTINSADAAIATITCPVPIFDPGCFFLYNKNPAAANDPIKHIIHIMINIDTTAPSIPLNLFRLVCISSANAKSGISNTSPNVNVLIILFISSPFGLFFD